MKSDIWWRVISSKYIKNVATCSFSNILKVTKVTRWAINCVIDDFTVSAITNTTFVSLVFSLSNAALTNTGTCHGFPGFSCVRRNHANRTRFRFSSILATGFQNSTYFLHSPPLFLKLSFIGSLSLESSFLLLVKYRDHQSYYLVFPSLPAISSMCIDVSDFIHSYEFHCASFTLND